MNYVWRINNHHVNHKIKSSIIRRCVGKRTRCPPVWVKKSFIKLLLSVPKTPRFENAETLRFLSRGPKKSLAIFLRFLLRFSGDFLRFLRQNLRFSTLRFENAAIFLRLRFFGTLRSSKMFVARNPFRAQDVDPKEI